MTNDISEIILYLTSPFKWIFVLDGVGMYGSVIFHRITILGGHSDFKQMFQLILKAMFAGSVSGSP